METPKRRPNIVFITTDQQRGDCLGCAGHPVLETPYLDHLASQGAYFPRAYSAVPACTPARAALLTGMNQWNHGRLTMAGNGYMKFPATLPGELSKAGYHTAAAGKMHFSPQRALYGYHEMRLDESSRTETDGFVSDYRKWFEENKSGPYGYRDHSIDWNSWMARPSHLLEHEHPTWWTATEGIRFLETRDPTSPFFLWLSFARPHSPFDPPQSYFDMYDRMEIPEPVVGEWAKEFDARNTDPNAPVSHLKPVEQRRAMVAYFANITFIDHQIGRFLYEFGKRFPADKQETLFVFTSDHGEMLGDHHHWRKTYAYEGSARVPMIVSYPQSWKGIERGTTHHEVVEMQDIMPTLLNAAGVAIPKSVDGRSMLDIPRGKGERWRKWVMGEYTSSYERPQSCQYLVSSKRKYIWFHYTGKELYFDLEKDPTELHDLTGSSSYAKELEECRNELARINEERGDHRGKDDKLVVQEEGKAVALSPNFYRWREEGDKEIERRFALSAEHF